MNTRFITGALLGASLLATSAHAHGGRRFEIKVVNDQLVAQGYISTGVDDMGGVVRPYYNALHDHWANLEGVTAATADLPGFDIITPGPLQGHGVTATLTGARRWVNPPLPPAGVTPVLEPIDQTVFVSFDGTSMSTDAPGTLVLATGIGAGGALDLDVVYEILDHPSAVIYVMEFTLATDAPGVADSDTVHVLLSPDGDNPMERLHHAALHLENFLGTPACAGDLDGDGVVGSADLAALLAAWGGDGADLDGDGVTGSADLAVVLAAWGDCVN